MISQTVHWNFSCVNQNRCKDWVPPCHFMWENTVVFFVIISTHFPVASRAIRDNTMPFINGWFMLSLHSCRVQRSLVICELQIPSPYSHPYQLASIASVMSGSGKLRGDLVSRFSLLSQLDRRSYVEVFPSVPSGYGDWRSLCPEYWFCTSNIQWTIKENPHCTYVQYQPNHITCVYHVILVHFQLPIENNQNI